jgi:GLPGLI family protein
MEKSFLSFQILIVLFLLPSDSSFGQEVTGGKVQYEQYSKFDYSLFGEEQYVKEWVATMPRGRKSIFTLSFNTDRSLYEEDMSEKNISSDKRTMIVMEKMAYVQPPNPVIKEVYNDFEKSRQIVKVEFMTRFFLIESDIETQAWRPGRNTSKIQGYVCMDATMKMGEETITAWYTPNIPVSLGPKNYGGLPGLILAVDINGENVLLATAVELTPPPEDTISSPTDGRKVTQEEFDKLVAEKVKEYKEDQESKSEAKGEYEKF